MSTPARQIAALALSLLLAATMDLSAARYALLIGSNDGGNSVEPLRWAEKDATRFAALLKDLGDFEPDNMAILIKPDSAAIDSTLRAIHRELGSSQTPGNALFLLYYSGHADGTDILLGTSRFALKALQRALDSLPAGIRIGIFDACQSGAVTAYKGGKKAEPFYLKSPPKIKGQIIIASTTPHERAQESESLKGSIFSFYWLSGLRGSADFSGDRRVTLDEAYQYAYRKTVETSTLTSGEAQHPMYRFNIHGQGDIILTDLTDKKGGVLFDRTCEGKFLVLSDSYTDIHADFYKKKNSEWFISLEPGTYRVINSINGEVGASDLRVNRTGGTIRFSPSRLKPVERIEHLAKGTSPASTETGASAAPSGAPATRPLSTYTWGLGGAVLWTRRGNPDGWGPVAELAFSNLLYCNERWDLFIDLLYQPGGLNGGAQIGFDYRFKQWNGRFFTGSGVGLFYFKQSGDNTMTPALTVHPGFLTAIGRRVSFVVQLPYTMLLGASSLDHRFGLGIKLLISGKYRDVTVLEY
ncbi:MAG: caspase family protein [Chitinispirillaceae bacterium]|nr:caspase family protein [Chitinispirillaceae bacterium]